MMYILKVGIYLLLFNYSHANSNKILSKKIDQFVLEKASIEEVLQKLNSIEEFKQAQEGELLKIIFPDNFIIKNKEIKVSMRLLNVSLKEIIIVIAYNYECNVDFYQNKIQFISIIDSSYKLFFTKKIKQVISQKRKVKVKDIQLFLEKINIKIPIKNIILINDLSALILVKKEHIKLLDSCVYIIENGGTIEFEQTSSKTSSTDPYAYE